MLSLTLVVGKSVYLKICSRIFCMLMTSTIYKYICKQKLPDFNLISPNKRTGGLGIWPNMSLMTAKWEKGVQSIVRFGEVSNIQDHQSMSTLSYD